jgi:hypothetical protein
VVHLHLKHQAKKAARTNAIAMAMFQTVDALDAYFNRKNSNV